MQKLILKYKNYLLLIVTLLLVVAIVTHITLGNTMIVEGLLVIASIFGGAPIFVQAIQALKVRIVSIDLLVSIAIIGALFVKNFEESAVVAFLFLLGAYLEQRTLNKTRSAIQNLVALSPETALKLESNGEFVETDIDEIDVSDTILVKTGTSVPVDGVVTFGGGTVNEASITGESIPVSKEVGDKVFAGTMLEDGMLHVKTERVGEETTFGKIIELVEEAQDSKSEAERFIDRFAKYYTPFILVLAIVIWMVTKNLELAVTILVLGCPGALVIGVPVSNVAGLGNGARNGILLKGSEVIHRLSHIDTILFDKTGTLTYGTPRVNEEIIYSNMHKNAINYLVSLESSSNHPLAKAIIDYYDVVEKYEVTDLNVVKGGGMTATIDGQQIIVGNRQILDQFEVEITETINNDIARLESEGNSIVITVVDGTIALIHGIQDQVRDGLKQDLERLKALGVKKQIVLSGDNQGTVNRVVQALALTEGRGNMLPNDKSAVVSQLQKNNETVAFIGDGINDSPSLALADIGIAMGSGTDVAIETSNVVLMNEDFHHLPHAIGLAKAIRRNMIQNIVIALLVVVVLLLSIIFSNWMNMAIGMFVHEASILVVILNGMRLIKYKQKI
ncbi:heavy metal translocating P-type ATPase [Staphylococcus sp. IVB6238]|uniref:heavy metal translocating P-type ATPase n=1 Tax=Staphylococcus sp. IVB6238 TaxID=2989770 RepID=UPI0021D2EB45|nr:heavy metal translocating P-type ATPase [Staphylococcus sp. IVB6238]UXR74748.1 heavy metal translocating P-type ATPase [Staphylococcus sp. IVB6238]